MESIHILDQLSDYMRTREFGITNFVQPYKKVCVDKRVVKLVKPCDVIANISWKLIIKYAHFFL